MANNGRPAGHQRKVTGKTGSVGRTGSGTGLGKTGGGNSFGGARPGGVSSGGSSGDPGRRGTRAGGGGRSPLTLIIILAIVLLGGGGGLSGLLGGGGSGSSGSGGSGSSYSSSNSGYSSSNSGSGYSSSNSGSSSSGSSSGTSGSLTSSGGLGSLLSGLSGYSDLSSLFGSTGAGSITGTQYSGSAWSSSLGQLNTRVAAGSRDKFTEIAGNGRDTVTIMVYMCGTDLESRSGMATSDLQEMAAANLSDNVNIIVYTGGCTRWRVSGISNTVNQIYQLRNGQLNTLEKNYGTGSMTNPSTLTGFIQYCKKNFKADRYDLIFWDHGGGSISGYGYDENYPRSGSMNLANIQKAVKDGGVKFDIIGFDACLMATAETALALAPYGDYLLASEETEPGTGWYYTNWLNKLSQNTSMPTLEIGKNIVDDFIAQSAKAARGQSTTLSLIDLAEFSHTIPDKLSGFAGSTSKLITDKKYSTVSSARNGSREFGSSSRIDQVDLVNLAENMGTDAGKELASALKEAVKYNRTSSDMSNSYGVSIYFPYKRLSSVDSMVSTYKAIGMDSDYGKCIQQFATVEAGGQSVNGGYSAYQSLFGGSSGGSAYGSSYSGSSDMLGSLLSSFLGGDVSGISGLDSSAIDFLTGSGFTGRDLEGVLDGNLFDASALSWTETEDGTKTITLTKEQWALVQTLELNMYVDDGQGYLNLGLDNLFEITEDGQLIGDPSAVWLALNGQIVPYYHICTTEDDGGNYTVVGRVPAILNDDEYVNLIVVFDQDNPDGFVAGYRTDYREGETDTLAKAVTELSDGDTLEFICDGYDYDGNFDDSYPIGKVTVDGDVEVTYLEMDGDVNVCYRLTDIYNNQYWTPVL